MKITSYPVTVSDILEKGKGKVTFDVREFCYITSGHSIKYLCGWLLILQKNVTSCLRAKLLYLNDTFTLYLHDVFSQKHNQKSKA